jgi:hypothetical protein
MSSLIRRIERRIERKNGNRIKSLRKGTWGRHLINREVEDDREYVLHATKGWRCYRE